MTPIYRLIPVSSLIAPGRLVAGQTATGRSPAGFLAAVDLAVEHRWAPARSRYNYCCPVLPSIFVDRIGDSGEIGILKPLWTRRPDHHAPNRNLGDTFVSFGPTDFLIKQSIVPIVGLIPGAPSLRCAGTASIVIGSGYVATASQSRDLNPDLDRQRQRVTSGVFNTEEQRC